MPHTDPARGVSLPPSAFAAAFPFHLAFGPDLRLRQVGVTLARLLPGASPGALLSDHFRTVRPARPVDFEGFCRQPDAIVYLEATATPLLLKGRMLHSPEQDCLIFLSTPAGSDDVNGGEEAAPAPGVAARMLTPAEGVPRPIRILVAADTPAHLHVAARILEDAGAQVDRATDGHTAVDMAARTRYDLVLMDLQMPVPDASLAAMAIRAAERLRDDEPVPIVGVARAAEGTLEQCLEAGMNDCLVEPLTMHDLVATADRLIDRRPAVLIADDAPEIRHLVKHCLRDTCRVVQAVDGREALVQFGRQRISVVLLDMNMPVMDGYAAAAAIRRLDTGRHVPIVAVTGNEESESRERAAAAGCSMHLMKPVRLATLFSTVETAMRQAMHGSDAPSAVEPPATGSRVPPVHLDIDPLLADLVPGYLRDKRRQIVELRRFIVEHDMDRVTRIAHDIKGTGTAYGIPDVTRLGRALEEAGQQRDEGHASVLVEELDSLLARVQQQLGG